MCVWLCPREPMWSACICICACVHARVCVFVPQYQILHSQLSASLSPVVICLSVCLSTFNLSFCFTIFLFFFRLFHLHPCVSAALCFFPSSPPLLCFFFSSRKASRYLSLSAASPTLPSSYYNHFCCALLSLTPVVSASWTLSLKTHFNSKSV